MLVYRYRELGSRILPAIPIILNGEDGTTLQTEGILDSGSTAILIPNEIAKFLKLKLGKDIDGRGVEGEVKVRESRIRMRLGRGSETYNFVFNCCVSLEEDPKRDYPHIILGRPFFSHFVITFDEQRRKITLKRSETQK